MQSCKREDGPSKVRMDTQHPQWRDFCARLAAALVVRSGRRDDFIGGCNHSLLISLCLLHNWLPLPPKLPPFENIDVSASLRWMQEQGGYCDCEVLMNCDVADAPAASPV